MSPAKKAGVRLQFATYCALASVSLLSSSLASANTTIAAPAISGAPATKATVGTAYSFQPTARDPNGRRLYFGVWGKPSWLSFDHTTGRLYGTPTAADVRTDGRIGIWASDGYAQASLPSFWIVVSAAQGGGAPLPPGGVTISWTPPTENTNGSTLTNLAGYHLYYGKSQSSLNQVANITNPGLASYTVDNLAAGTWYFAMTSVNTSGAESPRTAVLNAVVQ